MTNATPEMQPPTAQPFAEWNPTRGIWETTQLDLYGLLAPFSAIWPTCGWMHDGSAYRLALSALLTNASASSPSPTVLVRTPLASDSSRGGESLEQVRARRGTIALSHQVIDLAPARTAWLTEAEQRGGDAVVPDRGHLHRWGRYASAIARWEHITGRPPRTSVLERGERTAARSGVRGVADGTQTRLGHRARSRPHRQPAAHPPGQQRPPASGNSGPRRHDEHAVLAPHESGFPTTCCPVARIVHRTFLGRSQ